MALPPPSETSVALVTGASSGIGEAIARELAARGHSLALAARREERLDQLAADLAEQHGTACEVVRADLGEAAGRDVLAAHLEQAGKQVGILVNNAGFGDAGNFVDADRERLLAMIRLNCEALTDLQGRYLPEMVGRGAGAVINIASTASFQPIPGNAVYAATKAFVLSLSEATHGELGGTGVSLTAVCPGPVRTEFPDAAGIADAEERTPDIVWLSAEAVAKAAVEGAEKGKRVVVPGLLNRAGALGGQHAPRALILPLAKRVWGRAL
jgi:short-subunit dehydrogenase